MPALRYAERMPTFRIALANLPYPSSPDEAVARVEAAVAEAGAAGAGLVCFPECYVPGYRAPGKPVPPHDPAFQQRAWERAGQAASKAGVGVVLGTERRVDGDLRITALVIGPDGGVLGWQDKIQLDPPEDALYRPGGERHLFQVGPLTFGIAICHEGWRYPETVRWAARRGAQLVLHPHYSWPKEGAFRPERFGDPQSSFHEKAVLCRAAENTIFFASVNCAEPGAQTTSAVARPDGSVLAWQPYGAPGLLLADLDLEAATGHLASRLRTAP